MKSAGDPTNLTESQPPFPPPPHGGDPTSPSLVLPSLLQVPLRVETLVKGGQLYAAVQAHLQAASMLEREGIMAVSSIEL